MHSENVIERVKMSIIDLDQAIENGVRSSGAVYIQSQPQVRSGRKDDFMVGRFVNQEQDVEFKIWEEQIFSTVLTHGPGVYEAEVIGSEFNNQIYLTVLSIKKEKDYPIKKQDFLPNVEEGKVERLWDDARETLSSLGVSDKCWKLLDKILNSPIIGDRFWIEGAATNHHDNLIGGLAHHSIKMLRILATLIDNEEYLDPHVDLLTMGTVLHDIGKVFEYNDLEMAKYWYSNHRARGLEYLAEFRDEIMSLYNEKFYRNLQSIIIGHHGDYGDRPTTVACAIVHYIDTIESQVTDLIQMEKKSHDGRIFVKDWGYLAGLNY